MTLLRGGVKLTLMKKLFLYIFLGLLLCNAGVAEEIIVHYSVDVYDRFKIEKLDDKNKVNFAIERVSQRLREVISARGFTASVGKTTSEIKATSVAGHFHVNLEIAVYPGLKLSDDDQDETFAYLTSKRCDGDVFHMWAAWSMEKVIDILISRWDDYVFSQDIAILDKCPFKFPAIQSID